jgi:mRNA-degrading endonuclease YafQ of YafQ-DinJ toxin-antitoxin module
VSYTLVATSHFERRLARFRRAHPELRQRLAQVLRDLESDPFQPHLRLLPLKGRLAGLHAVRLTYAYRLTLTLKLAEHEIILLDVGSHDEVYD